MTELEKKVQRLLDAEEIRDVMLRYARAIDRLDVELFRSCFWKDGGFEDGIVDGPAKDFSASLIAGVGNMFAATQHFITNTRTDFESPTVAFTESYFVAFHRLSPGEQTLDAMLGARRMREMGGDYTRSYELWVGGRYFDRVEKRANVWRIHKRRFVSDWTSSSPDGALGTEGFAQMFKLQGSRDLTDPSYSRSPAPRD